jgi:hypothetical protein
MGDGVGATTLTPRQKLAELAGGAVVEGAAVHPRRPRGNH